MKRRVDVIFITYNQAQYVAQGIESIISQKVTDEIDVRVIVADDCSTDDTLDIIKSYETNSPYPFLYTDYGKNLGYHENYHRTFQLCDGDYIAILEGDDWWHSDKHLQQHIDFLNAHPAFSMSFNRIRGLNAFSNQFSVCQWPYKKDFYPIMFKSQIIDGNQLGNFSACVFRTNLIHSIPEQLFKMDFAEWEISMWVAQYGPIGYLKESTSTYRNNQKGEWTKLSQEKMKESMLTTLKQMNELFNYKYNKWFKQGIYNIEHDIQSEPYMTWKTRIKKWLKIIK